jgi:hypothetical protein
VKDASKDPYVLARKIRNKLLPLQGDQQEMAKGIFGFQKDYKDLERRIIVAIKTSVAHFADVNDPPLEPEEGEEDQVQQNPPDDFVKELKGQPSHLMLIHSQSGCNQRGQRVERVRPR